MNIPQCLFDVVRSILGGRFICGDTQHAVLRIDLDLDFSCIADAIEQCFVLCDSVSYAKGSHAKVHTSGVEHDGLPWLQRQFNLSRLLDLLERDQFP